jgi:hypothetical protein
MYLQKEFEGLSLSCILSNKEFRFGRILRPSLIHSPRLVQRE